VGPPRLLEGEHSFQLQGKSWRAVDGESFVSAKEAERAVRLNQLHRPVVEVDPHLDGATLEVIPALALDFTCCITERDNLEGYIGREVSFDRQPANREPIPSNDDLDERPPQGVLSSYPDRQIAGRVKRSGLHVPAQVAAADARAPGCESPQRAEVLRDRAPPEARPAPA